MALYKILRRMKEVNLHQHIITEICQYQQR